MCITVPNNNAQAANLTPPQSTPQSDSTQRAGQTSGPTRNVALRAVQNNNATLGEAPSQSSSSPKIGLALHPLRWSKEHKLSTTAVESQQIAASVQARLPNQQDNSEVRNIVYCCNQINKNEKYEGLLPSELDKWNCVKTLSVSAENKILQSNLASLSTLTRNATNKESLSLGANYLAELVDKCADKLSDPSAQTKVQEVAPRLLNLLIDPDPEVAKENSTQLEQLKKELFQLAAHSTSTQEMETIGLLCALIVDVQNFSALKISQDQNLAALLQQRPDSDTAQSSADSKQPAPATEQQAPAPEQAPATPQQPAPASAPATPAPAQVNSEHLQSYDFGFYLLGSKLEYKTSKLQELGSCQNANYQAFQQHGEQIKAKGQKCLDAALSGNMPEALRLLEELSQLNQPLADFLKAQIATNVDSFVTKMAVELLGQSLDTLDINRLSSDQGDYLNGTIKRLSDFSNTYKSWPSSLREACLNKLNELLQNHPNISALNLDSSLSAEDKLNQAITALQLLMAKATQQLDDADAFIKSFGVESVPDLDKEYGTARGGLVGLAQHLYAASFIAPEGKTAPNSLQTLKNIVNTIGDIFDDQTVTTNQGTTSAPGSNTNATSNQSSTTIPGKCPELKAQLNSLMNIIEDRAKTYEDKVAAFQSIKAILITLGTLGPQGDTLPLTINNLFNAKNAVGSSATNPQAQGTSAANTPAPGNAAVNANSVMSFDKLCELLQDPTGKKFNQALSQAIQDNVNNPGALKQLSALASNLDQCFNPGSHVNSIKQNAKLADQLSVVMKFPVVAGILEAQQDEGTPNAGYHFWASAKESSNLSLKNVYEAVQKVKDAPSPENLLHLNLCINALEESDLEQLRKDYAEKLTQANNPQGSTAASNAQSSGQTSNARALTEANNAYFNMRLGLERCKEFNYVITQAAYAMFAAQKGIPLNMQGNPAKDSNRLNAHQKNEEFYKMCEAQAAGVAKELAGKNNDEKNLTNKYNEILTAGVGNGPLGRSALSKATHKLNFNTAPLLKGRELRALIDPISVHNEHIYLFLNHGLEKTAQANNKGQVGNTAPLSQAELLTKFKEEVNTNPLFKSLAAQFTGKVQEQQQFLAEQFINHLDILGFTTSDPQSNAKMIDENKLSRIHGYYKLNGVSEIGNNLFKQEGQTQGVMLYLVKEALIKKFDDMPDGRMANLVPSARRNAQGQPITVDSSHKWTIPELKEGLINALQTPLHQAEARVIAEKLYESLPDADKREIVNKIKTQTANYAVNGQAPANTNAPASNKTYKWEELDHSEKQAVLKQLFAHDDNYFYQKGVLDSFAQVSEHEFNDEERKEILTKCLKEALEHEAGTGSTHVTIKGLPNYSDDLINNIDNITTNDGRKTLLNQIGSDNINLGLYAVMTGVHESSVEKSADNKTNTGKIKIIGVKAGSELNKISKKFNSVMKSTASASKIWQKSSSALVGGAGFLINRNIDALNTHGKEAVADILLNMRRGDTQNGAQLRAILRCGFEDVAYLSGAKGLESVVKDYNNLESAIISLDNLNRARQLDPELDNQIRQLSSFKPANNNNEAATVELKELLPLMMARYMARPSGANQTGMTQPDAHALSKHIVDAICENPSLKKTVAGFVPRTMSSFDRQDMLQRLRMYLHFDTQGLKQDQEKKRNLDQIFLANTLMNMDYSSSIAITREGSVKLFSFGKSVSAGAGVEGGVGQANFGIQAQGEAGFEVGVEGSFNSSLIISRDENGSFTFEVGKGLGIGASLSATASLNLSFGIGMTEDDGRKIDPSVGANIDLGVSAEVSLGAGVNGGTKVTFKNAYDAGVFLQRVLERKVEERDLANMSSFTEGMIQGGFNFGACFSAGVNAGVASNFVTPDTDHHKDGSVTETKELLGNKTQETTREGSQNILGQQVDTEIGKKTNLSGPITLDEVNVGLGISAAASFGGSDSRTYRFEENETTQTITQHRQAQLLLKANVDIEVAGKTFMVEDNSRFMHALDNEYIFSRDKMTNITNQGFTDAAVNSSYTFSDAAGLRNVLKVNDFNSDEIDKLISAMGEENCGKRFTSITLNRSFKNPPPDEKADLFALSNYEISTISLTVSQEQDQTSIANKVANVVMSQTLGLSTEKKSEVTYNIYFDRRELQPNTTSLSKIINPSRFVATDAIAQNEKQQSDTMARQKAV